MLTTIWSVILALLILLAMITIHEFGHYVAGKILGFKITEFAIGFGPALFKRFSRRTGELFSVRALPLGGYCAFYGEDGRDEEDDETEEKPIKKREGAFNDQAPWKRIIVLVAGATMNYLLALVLIIISFFAFGQMAFKVNNVAVDEAYPTEYSLVNGDIVVGCNDKTIYIATDFISALNGKKQGDKVPVTVIRDGKQTQVEVVLRADCTFANSESISPVWRALGADTRTGDDGNLYWDISAEGVRFSFFPTIGRAVGYSGHLAGTIFKVLGELLTGSLSISSVGGPVTTIKMTSEIAVQGLQSFLEIASYIGVNLAVFNLLPIPALDGSKVIFCAIEWVFKKPVPRKVEAVIHAIGFVLIFGFAILVDVLQFI